MSPNQISSNNGIQFSLSINPLMYAFKMQDFKSYWIYDPSQLG